MNLSVSNELDIFEYEEEDNFHDTLENKFLSFQVGRESYAIKICYVSGIIKIQKISELPGIPSYVKGMINRREKVIPVIDIRQRFQLPERPYDKRTCIILVEIQNQEYGLIVDRVNDSFTLLNDNISPPPEYKKIDTSERYIWGIGHRGDKMVIMLNINKVLCDNDAEILEKTITAL